MNTQKTFDADRPTQTEDEVDLYEEELSAEKHLRDLGEVKLNKRIVTTQKQITVPLMHEEVIVERVPYDRPLNAAPQATSSSFDELRVPLCEEEVSAQKYTRPLGEVRLHKRVVMTKKQITVPVMHEEIRIERVPAERKPIDYADTMFKETTQTIPLHDEEVEIRKYPVAREGVRFRKTSLQEERTATADLRREELDIEQPEAIAPSWTESRTPREFSESTQVIPLFEEEIEIRKYPVLREEVRVNRAALQEERTTTADAYREELDVEEPAALNERYRRAHTNGSSR